MSANAPAVDWVYSTQVARTCHKWEELSCQYRAQVQYWLLTASQTEARSLRDVTDPRQSVATAAISCGAPEKKMVINRVEQRRPTVGLEEANSSPRYLALEK